MNKPINIFYEEPDPDRWFTGDRYPRRLIRRLVRGKPRPGGVMMVALQLMKGLDRMQVPYRFNDFKYISQHPEEIACIIGKPQLFFERVWPNPVIFGAGIYSHPIEHPDLFERYPNVQRFLVPGEWMRKMCEPYYGDRVLAWPAGIDTDNWAPLPGKQTIDFLVYDKIRWDHDSYSRELIGPLCEILNQNGCSYRFIRYGHYTHKQLQDELINARAVIFLCEHETQGLAYQQILSTDTPILAWDRGGYWQDPSYYPEVRFAPVSSVPYWSTECGERFEHISHFEDRLQLFLRRLAQQAYAPRHFITKNLSLVRSAEKYLEIVKNVYEDLADR